MGEIHALGRPQGGDLTDPQRLLAALDGLQPSVVVNAAAYTAVDKAESEPELARLVNATAVGHLAQWCARRRALLLHYSTDYVFDGSGDQARTEEGPTGPVNVYGQTKLEGEHAIMASGCPHLIFRTSWVYGQMGQNFAKTMLKLAAERPALRVIADQIGAPTGADLIADMSAHALQAHRGGRMPDGLYHLCASGETSWHGYAECLFEAARSQGRSLAVESVTPIASAEYPTAAKRPLNSRLGTAKLAQTLGCRLPHWTQGVRRLVQLLG